ncbi:amino acid permease [Sciscionella marina]|uniref:amino acid permease n=1 Tax=Sciscionella marina TaxID=508770 RepID=UPI0003A69FAC|nr:amino acid permease [Sciscionella marina]
MPLMRTLSIEDVKARSEKSQLKRRLSARDLVGVGIGVIIGTGIFTLTGIQAKEHAGPAITLSFVIGGIVATLAALCYAELASAVPTAGSAYTYAFATLGEPLAWIIGWDLLLEFGLGAATVSRSWSGYLQNLFDLPTSLFGEKAPFNLGAVLIEAILATIAVLGIKLSSWFTNTLVIVKVGVCVLIIVVGAFFVKAANLSPFVPPSAPPAAGSPGGLHQPLIQAALGIEPAVYGFGGLLTAAAIVFFGYTGFESLANLGEETKKPSRDMPIGLIGALAICTVLYVGVAFVVTGMVSYRTLDDAAPLAVAFDSVGLGWAGVLIGIGAIAGMTSVMMVQLLTISRTSYTMARDGLLPKSLGEPHKRLGTPHRTTIIAAVVIMAIAAFIPISELSDMVSIGGLSAMLIVAVAVPILRRKRPDLKRSFRVPWSPVVPIVAALLCLYLMLNLDMLTWLRFGIWLAVGLVIYIAYGRRHSVLSKRSQ